jgi:NAD(P)-dependent dehydrogenase (short-subunit alcohol dehydrogenase family)
MTQKTVIVTGGNTGMGFETARQLVLQGYDVVVASRSQEKGQTAVEKINAEADKLGSAGQASNAVINLTSLGSVRQFTETFKARHSRLHVLICNAGIMNPPYSLTEDGFESQFQANYLGHFLLTNLLLDLLLSSEDPRIINISSLSAEKGVVNTAEGFERVARCPIQEYTPITSYRESKLAQTLFTLELHERFSTQGLFSASIHPGVVNTDLFYRNMPGWAKILIEPVARLGYLTGGLRSPAKGAETAVFLAQEPAQPSGQYWFNKKLRPPTPTMQNKELATRLWEMSLKWCEM